MTNGPHNITVKLDVTVSNEKPISETVAFSVPALCVTYKKLEKKSGPVNVSVAGVCDGPPSFVLVRPYEVSEQPVKKTFAELLKDHEEAAKGANSGRPLLEYSTAADKDCTIERRKPLLATHVFYAGQTEWITDLPDKNTQIKQLVFWNNCTTDAITVQIIVGYVPGQGT